MEKPTHSADDAYNAYFTNQAEARMFWYMRQATKNIGIDDPFIEPFPGDLPAGDWDSIGNRIAQLEKSVKGLWRQHLHLQQKILKQLGGHEETDTELRHFDVEL